MRWTSWTSDLHPKRCPGPEAKAPPLRKTSAPANNSKSWAQKKKEAPRHHTKQKQHQQNRFLPQLIRSHCRCYLPPGAASIDVWYWRNKTRKSDGRNINFINFFNSILENEHQLFNEQITMIHGIVCVAWAAQEGWNLSTNAQCPLCEAKGLRFTGPQLGLSTPLVHSFISFLQSKPI